MQQPIHTPQPLHIDAVKAALNRRLRSCSGHFRLYAVLAFVMVVIGIAVFAYLWANFRDDDSTLIKSAASASTFLITSGVTGLFATRALAVREMHSTGRDWLQFYEDICGPPPQEIAADVEARILDWLEG